MNDGRLVADMSVRIHWPVWIDEKRFDEFLELLKRTNGALDEIAFFSSTIHSVIPLEVVRKRATILCARIEKAKEEGYRAGINFLSTSGHIDEYLDAALKGDFTGVVGMDGVQAKGSFCMNDANFRRYLAEAYAAMAEAKPDFIWLDDDIRLNGHNPAACGCFCDKCLELFNSENGFSFTRETLLAAFDNGPVADKKRIRDAWLARNSKTIRDALVLIERSVRKVDPSIALGLMTPEHFYDRNDSFEWGEALSGDAKGKTMWRPGGGFYSDDSMPDLLAKAHSIGRQISLLKGSVPEIQSEIENFPYQPIKKSIYVNTLESAVYMAAGCTGSAYNVVGMLDEDLTDYEPLFKELAAKRPFYDLLRNVFGDSLPSGVSPLWNKQALISKNLLSGPWEPGEWIRGVHESPNELLSSGLPASYDPARAEVLLLADDMPLAFERDELEKVLARNVYVDAKALLHLQSMGLGSLAGFKVEELIDKDCVEMLTDDPLNGQFAGMRRDCVQSFWGGCCARLSSLDSSARVLGRKASRISKTPEFPCLGIFENKLGGRVAVAGYAPWSFLQSRAKTTQLKRMFRWLSKDELSGYVESYRKAGLWVRRSASGKMSALLLNASLDAAEDLTIALKTSRREATVVTMNCEERRIAASSSDGVYSTFKLPPLGPWAIALAVV